MLKKIVFLISILSYTTAFSAHSGFLSPQETRIYNAVKQQAWKMNNIDGIENFLKETGISSQQLYNILNKQNESLSAKIDNIWYYLNSLDEAKITKSVAEPLINLLPELGKSSIPGEGAIAFAAMILGPAVIGIPALIIGTTMKKFMTPTNIKNIISSGLMGAGALLSTPVALAGLGFTSHIVEKKIKGVIYRKNSKQRQMSEISAEYNLIQPIIWKLKEFYPEIIKQ